MTAARKFLAKLVEAGGDPPEVLELVEESLDEVAPSVEVVVDRYFIGSKRFIV